MKSTEIPSATEQFFSTPDTGLKNTGRRRFHPAEGATIALLVGVFGLLTMFIIDPPPPAQIKLISQETPLADSTRRLIIDLTPTATPFPSAASVNSIDISKCPPYALDRRFNPPLPYPAMIDKCR